jgi:hypothetical protein
MNARRRLGYILRKANTRQKRMASPRWRIFPARSQGGRELKQGGLTKTAGASNNRKYLRQHNDAGWGNGETFPYAVNLQTTTGEKNTMKLTKLACTALLGMVAWGGQAAPAQFTVGTTTDYMKLNFTLTLSSQQPSHTTGHTTTYQFKTVKLTNKDILNQLAFLAQTTWPAGAQLEYDFTGSYGSDAVSKVSGYDGQLIVADKTGTNVLFYAGDGVDNTNMYGYFELDPFYYAGVYDETKVNGTPGSDKWVEFYNGYFIFQINDYINDDANYMDLYGEGLNTEFHAEAWTSRRYSGNESISMLPIGTGVYQNNSNNLLTGSIVGVETWALENQPSVAIAHSKTHKQ